jgi:hypothetical protein
MAIHKYRAVQHCYRGSCGRITYRKGFEAEFDDKNTKIRRFIRKGWLVRIDTEQGMASKEFKGVDWGDVDEDGDEKEQKLLAEGDGDKPEADTDMEIKADIQLVNQPDVSANADDPANINLSIEADDEPIVYAQEYPKRKKKGDKGKAKANLLDEANDGEMSTDKQGKAKAKADESAFNKGTGIAMPAPKPDDWLDELIKQNELIYTRHKGKGINPKHLKIMRRRAIR